MEMLGQRSLPVPRDQVWAALNDPAVLKLCVPGCEKFDLDGPDRYAIGMLVRIGPVSARFQGKIALSDLDPPNSYRIAFTGEGGAAGFGRGSSTVQLEDAEAGCELKYNVTASVGGKLAQLGQRLIDGAARSMAEDFFKRFEQEMRRRHPVQAQAQAPEPPPPATATHSMRNYRWPLAAGGAILLALILWSWLG